MITVGILAPTPVARAGLRSLLMAEPGSIEVVAEASAGNDLPELVRAFRPDLLLLDPSPLDDDVFDLVPHLSAHHPSLRIIMLGPGHDDVAVEALRAGVDGYLALDTTGPALLAAVQAVAHGIVVLDPSVAAGLLPRLSDLAAQPLPLAGPPPPLTNRELEVLQLLAAGLTNRGIAARLNISEHTAKFHVSAILGKFGAGSRAEVVAMAARQGLILI